MQEKFSLSIVTTFQIKSTKNTISLLNLLFNVWCVSILPTGERKKHTHTQARAFIEWHTYSFVHAHVSFCLFVWLNSIETEWCVLIFTWNFTLWNDILRMKYPLTPKTWQKWRLLFFFPPANDECCRCTYPYTSYWLEPSQWAMHNITERQCIATHKNK